MPTQCGIDAAADLYDSHPEKVRPGDMAGLDRLLRPLVESAVATAAAPGENPPITAVRESPRAGHSGKAGDATCLSRR